MVVSSPPILDLAALENKGFLLLNDHTPAPAQRTLIVLGVARSGTTMAAGVLHHLGVEMGMGDRPNTVFEDVALAKAMESNDSAALRELIAARNAAHQVWGWKRPSAIQHIDRIRHHFRNPQYIVLFRDILAIAARNQISARSDVLSNMDNTLRQYAELMAFVRNCESRMLLISYEKAMLRPEDVVGAIAALAGVDDADRLRMARDFVRQDAVDYLVAARDSFGRGRMEQLAPRQVSGWGFMIGHDGPACVELWVNDRRVAVTVADLRRDDLRGKVHHSGRCGFEFRLPEEDMIRPGDMVRTRIQGDIKDLNGSPCRFAGPAENPS
jgi:hypothetical protein